MKQYQKHLIPQTTIIREALRVLNGMDDALMTLFVIDDNEKMLGTITDGDIRRALIAGASIEQPVETVMNKEFRCIRRNGFSLEQFHEYKKARITLLPVLDESGKITALKDLDSMESMLSRSFRPVIFPLSSSTGKSVMRAFLYS
jgi:signal-transduction protein with cAMP-binding, CBS, and nucleotidyltransferase domain